MDGRRFLEQYERSYFVLNETVLKVEQIWTRATKTTSILSDMPRGGSSDDKMAKYICEIEEIQEKLTGYQREAGEAMVEVMDTIKQVQKPNCFKVLWARYVNLEKSSYKIADKLGYTEDRVRHLLSEGIAEVEKILKERTNGN